MNTLKEDKIPNQLLQAIYTIYKNIPIAIKINQTFQNTYR
jgi:hypothetical protein